MAGDAPAASPATERRPLTLAPFRGLRFDPDVVGDLSTVISPPYDVLDAETVRTLENANRRNIVRLILSRRFERPYLAVRDYFGLTGVFRAGLDAAVAPGVASVFLRSFVCARAGAATNTTKTKVASSLRSFGDIMFSFS